MAGTNSKADALSGGPAVILVCPQMGENIGAAARAMLNFGLTDMRIVSPRDGWPNEKAYVMASRADRVLDKARVYERTEDAIADLQHVYATTARPRDMIKPVATPRKAGAELRAFHNAGEPCGILFGPERTGLSTEDVILADTIITVPVNPTYTSINLAQAVLLVSYEWFQSGDDTPGRQLDMGDTRLANKEELVHLFVHLEDELDQSGFFARIEAKRPAMVRNIRNMFQRANLMEQDVRTLRGIIKSLVGKRR